MGPAARTPAVWLAPRAEPGKCLSPCGPGPLAAPQGSGGSVGTTGLASPEARRQAGLTVGRSGRVWAPSGLCCRVVARSESCSDVVRKGSEVDRSRDQVRQWDGSLDRVGVGVTFGCKSCLGWRVAAFGHRLAEGRRALTVTPGLRPHLGRAWRGNRRRREEVGTMTAAGERC